MRFCMRLGKIDIINSLSLLIHSSLLVDVGVFSSLLQAAVVRSGALPHFVRLLQHETSGASEDLPESEWK